MPCRSRGHEVAGVAGDDGGLIADGGGENDGIDDVGGAGCRAGYARSAAGGRGARAWWTGMKQRDTRWPRRGYAGLYDMSPDDLPVIGAVPGIDNLYMIAGSSGHGFKLGPAVGEAVALLVQSGDSPLLRPFSPDRLLKTS